MKPPLASQHGASLATTAGITAVIALVAALSVLTQCVALTGVAASLAACSLAALVLGATGLYAGRNAIGLALDFAVSDAAASEHAASRGLARYHLGMAGMFAGAGLAVTARFALGHGALAWLAPAAAFVAATHAAWNALSWTAEARRRGSSRRHRRRDDRPRMTPAGGDPAAGPRSREGAMARSFSLVLGVLLLVMGLWGIVTGGHAHNLMFFGVNATHNLVHLLSGALAIGASLGGERYAKLYCLAFGTVYGLVAILGFVNVGAVVTLLNLNMADNLLHLAIAAVCLIVGAQSKAGTSASAIA